MSAEQSWLGCSHYVTLVLLSGGDGEAAVGGGGGVSSQRERAVGADRTQPEAGADCKAGGGADCAGQRLLLHDRQGRTGAGVTLQTAPHLIS